MCGICGFIEVNGGGNADKESLKDMADTIIHRGPDDEGLYSDGIASLANRRLSIIDLKSGKQPIFNEDGNICVVFNGEIYNHAEISNDLAKKGHRFTTNTDTEVLVHLYEEYGDEVVDHLDGAVEPGIDLEVRDWTGRKHHGVQTEQGSCQKRKPFKIRDLLFRPGFSGQDPLDQP